MVKAASAPQADPSSSKSSPAVDEPAEISLAAPSRKPFRKKFTTVRLAPEAVERQSRITMIAWNALGSEAAIAFLNSYSELLEGRPLDLAVASAAGFAAVEHEIVARTPRG
jgi:hypothetical protein